MPTNAQIQRAYTAHALTLIRYANRLGSDAEAELRDLARAIRALLLDSGLDRLGRRAMATLLRDIETAIVETYGRISDRQEDELPQLIDTEAEWAQSVGEYARAPSDAAINAAIASLLVMGAPIRGNWQRQAANLMWSVGNQVRQANSEDLDPRNTMIRVVGSGPSGRERGGAMERARGDARALTQTAVNSAAGSGRRAAWEAGGVNALRWHAVLDSRTTEGCALRAGKLYDLDYQPIQHTIPIQQPPPRHWWCRSILLPMVYGPDIPMPDDGGVSTFDQYLDTLSVDEQNALLGAGRADLYRRGVITQADLVNQNGRFLTLGELRAEIGLAGDAVRRQ